MTDKENKSDNETRDSEPEKPEASEAEASSAEESEPKAEASSAEESEPEAEASSAESAKPKKSKGKKAKSKKAKAKQEAKAASDADAEPEQADADESGDDAGDNEGPESPDEESSAGADRETSEANAPAGRPRDRSLIDSIMRGGVLVALGALVTAPLWYRDQMTENFAPTTFRADREGAGEEGGQSLEARLTREVVAIIRTATSDEIVAEDEVVSRLGGMLEEEGIGNDESRSREIRQLVADVAGRAAEMDGSAGFSDLQAQALQSTARMMSRSLITNLGGTLDEDEEGMVEGDWTPAAWPLISGYDYAEGMKLPDPVRDLDGQDVMAWGYLINLDENQYLLVQNLWSCCFGTPPDLHEAIVVRTEQDARRYEGRGVRVYGRFEASEETEDGYVTSLYRLDARHLRGM